MFLFKGNLWINETVIRSVKYQTNSYYSGDKNIFEKVGELISESFEAANVNKITNESSVDLDIAIGED